MLHEVNFDVLVNMWQQHQTWYVVIGVQTKGEKQLPNSDIQKEISVHQLIIQQFHEVSKAEQDRALCIGSDWNIHWHTPAPGVRDGQIDGTTGSALANGNSANAALSACGIANKVS